MSGAGAVRGAGHRGRDVLVDRTTNLTAVTVHPGYVAAQPGVSVDSFLATLKGAGLGLTAFLVMGAATLGGAVATGGPRHRWRRCGRDSRPGHSYSSVGNQVSWTTCCADPAPSWRCPPCMEGTTAHT